MLISDVCWLISTSPSPHGVHAAPKMTERMVYCQVASVGRSEFYMANQAGMSPEYVLKLSDTAEYQKEMELRFRGEKWKILRTYMTGDGGIELIVQRSALHGK